MMPFSRKTLAALVAIMAAYFDHAGLDLVFFRYGLEFRDPGSAHLVKRCLALIRAIEHGDAPVGSNDEIVMELLNEVAGQVTIEEPAGSQLVASLAIDGYEYSDYRLLTALPSVAGAPLAISGVEALLAAAGFPIALNHYRQAVDNFADANFEAANGQLRSAMEAFLRELAARMGGAAAGGASAALQWLDQTGKIDKQELGLFKGFWNAIQDNGPHAGTTNETEAMLRLQVATAIIRYAIAKVRLE